MTLHLHHIHHIRIRFDGSNMQQKIHLLSVNISTRSLVYDTLLTISLLSSSHYPPFYLFPHPIVNRLIIFFTTFPHYCTILYDQLTIVRFIILEIFTNKCCLMHNDCLILYILHFGRKPLPRHQNTQVSFENDLQKS